MSAAWPWLVLMLAGAAHGLNPLAGWMFCARWQDGAQPARRVRALAPLAAGHGAGVALPAIAAAAGAALPVSGPLLALAAGVVAVLLLLAARLARSPRAGTAALGLWCFAITVAAGAGLALVPAMAPLCGVQAAAAGSGTAVALAALAAVTAHLVGMLAASAAMAAIAAQAARRVRAWHATKP